MSYTYAGHYVGQLKPAQTYEVYVTSTRAAATLYGDRAKATTLLGFSVLADVSGNVSFFADPGAYSLITPGNESQVSLTFRTWPGGIDVSVVPDASEFGGLVANTLDQIGAPVASVAMNSQKLTGLGAGSAVGDSARLQDTEQVAGINPQTGTAYTLVLTDAGKLVTSSNVSAQTVSIPTNASVAFPVGTKIKITQIGAGVVTINAVSSGTTTVNSTGATPTAPVLARYGVAEAVKTAADVWSVSGQVA